MCRYTKLAKVTQQNKDAIKSGHDEITNYPHQLQSKMVKSASICGLRDSLENHFCMRILGGFLPLFVQHTGNSDWNDM